MLKKVIESLRNQTYSITNIIVINNSSTDGTEEWLYEQRDLLTFKQPNLGSSGGQFKSFAEAYKSDCDLIWIMDDDVVPDWNCLEKMIRHYHEKHILFPLRFKPDGSAFLNDCIKLNLTNPFKSIWEKVISDEDIKDLPIDLEGPTFEGPLFGKELIEAIGLPEKDFFIFADDTEYFIRAARAGFKLLLIPDAKLNRLLDAPTDGSFSWKTYYLIRNLVVIDRFHGSAAVKIIRPLSYLYLFGKYSKSFDDLKTTVKALFDGLKYKSSNTKKAVKNEIDSNLTA